MRVLAIEASGRLGSLALLDTASGEPGSVLEAATPERERTAQSLLPTMQELLRQRGWRPADIELVCVTTGPGSFTGLRIGIVTAKTFAYATDAKLVGVHTLAAIAAGAGDLDRPLWIVLDAQRQELFVAKFEPRTSLVEQARPETKIVAIDAWLNQIQQGDAVGGPPLVKLRSRLPAGVTAIEESKWHPQAAAVGQLGLQLLEHNGAVDPLELIPNYYRKSAAEEKARASNI